VETGSDAAHREAITLGLVLRCTARVAATAALLFTIYAFLPGTQKTTWEIVLIFVVVVAALIVLIVYDIRSILMSTHPGLRAVEAVATLVFTLIVAFSAVYLAMSHINRQSFNTPLDHINAFYFTVVVFSTVGFGDITAKTDTAQLVVSIQILLDLAFIAIVVRLMLGAVQSRTGGH
jgi:hypothetical protein